MNTRVIGNREVSALGFGCWAIGGPFSDTEGKPLGWGEVDDDESIAAIRRAHGAGRHLLRHRRRLRRGPQRAGARPCGRRPPRRGGHRQQVGQRLRRGHKGPHRQPTTPSSTCARPSGPRSSGSAPTTWTSTSSTSHRRSRTPTPLADAAEELVKEGLIRGYAWSTDDPERAAAWVGQARLRRRAARVQRPARRAGDPRPLRAARPGEHQPHPARHGPARPPRPHPPRDRRRHPLGGTGVAAVLRRRRADAGVGAPGRQPARDPHQRRPHPRTGRAGLAVGPQRADRSRSRASATSPRRRTTRARSPTAR